MRKLEFLPENYYHIYNRGVDKRKIFMEKDDYIRFLIGLLVYNSSKNHLITKWFSAIEKDSDPLRYIKDDIVDPPVGIAAFCLMPNHFHLVLTPLKKGGVSSFMHDLDCGFTNYFNAKYDRTGSLLEASFKAKWISGENYFKNLVRYVHLNPLDIKSKKWREEGMEDRKESIGFLKSYKWSSLPYYLRQNEIKMIDVILNPKMVDNYFPSAEDHLHSIQTWSASDYENLEHIRIEDSNKKPLNPIKYDS